MKGKHGAAAAKRREQQARDQVSTLEATIQDLKQKLSEARRKAEGAESARSMVTTLRLQLEDGTSDRVQELEAKNRALREKLHEAERENRINQKKHDRIWVRIIEYIGEQEGLLGGQRVERFMHIVTGGAMSPAIIPSNMRGRDGMSAEWVDAMVRKDGQPQRKPRRSLPWGKPDPDADDDGLISLGREFTDEELGLVQGAGT